MKAGLRTWVEIDRRALRSNAEQFFRLAGPRVRLMAVVKSNAYGHGLCETARALLALQRFRREGWFGVDSITEGAALRRAGVTNRILVLGHTLPDSIREAAALGITLTISSFDALAALARARKRPAFHLKIDTGMHRQGFLAASDMPELVAALDAQRLAPEGVFTHFASAKSADRRTRDAAYTLMQLAAFEKAAAALASAGYAPLIRHASATGGALTLPEARFDMLRIGMGLYGYAPSPESVPAIRHLGMRLEPALRWKTVVAETKSIRAGSRVGYDGIEVVGRPTRLAILPVGYWHGYDRGFSGVGAALLGGGRARVLGRVSMDMIAVDATASPRAQTGDEAVLIGRQGKASLLADEAASLIGTTAYELLTRINPLIKRIVV